MEPQEPEFQPTWLRDGGRKGNHAEKQEAIRRDRTNGKRRDAMKAFNWQPGGPWRCEKDVKTPSTGHESNHVQEGSVRSKP